jgi:hypothetical protein
MLGMWRESIAANMKTIAAGKDYAARHNLDGVYPVDLHAYDFMQYAYLQLGEDHKAKELMEEVAAIKEVFSPRLTTTRRWRRCRPVTCSSVRIGAVRQI